MKQSCKDEIVSVLIDRYSFVEKDLSKIQNMYNNDYILKKIKLVLIRKKICILKLLLCCFFNIKLGFTNN